MIDAQRAAVAHVVANQRRESLQPVLLHAEWILWRDAPGLSLERQRIRRRTDLRGQPVALSIRPGLGSCRIGAHRIVTVKPDRHPQRAGERLGLLQLLMRQPLQIQKELNALRMGRGKSLADGSLRVAPLLGPVQPSGMAMFLVAQVAVDRIETRMSLQTLPAGGDERAIPGGARRTGLQVPLAKFIEEDLQDLELEVGDRCVIHEVARPQRDKARRESLRFDLAPRRCADRVLGNLRHRNVEDVQEIPV